jgi:hypothetical protein
MVLLGANALVSPFKRLLKVSPSLLGELGIDTADTVHWDPAWPEAWYEPPDPPGWGGETRVAAIVLIRYDFNSTMLLDEIPNSEALNAVIHSAMASGMPAAEGFDRLFAMVDGANTYRLTFNSSIAAAEVLCNLMK